MRVSKIVAGALKAVGKKPLTVPQFAAKLGVTTQGVYMQLPNLKKVKGLKLEKVKRADGEKGRPTQLVLRRA